MPERGGYIKVIIEVNAYNTLILSMRHELQLTYEEYKSKNFSLVNCQIGKYIVLQKMGEGSYGEVYKGFNDQTKTTVAIKIIDLVAIQEDSCSPRVKEIRRRLARTESEIMSMLKSDHIMKCFDVYENKCMKIMMIEYCNGGTLYDIILKKGRISEIQAVGYMKQLISGLSVMHNSSIIHRDLKSQNIMLHNGIVKIIDLGFSKLLSGDGLTKTPLGTITTMAPEVIIKEKYGLKADIWSIGIIFYEMLYGTVPYRPAKPNEVYQSILSKDIFPNGGKIRGIQPSARAIDFMKQIFVVEQAKRIDWRGLLSHELFEETDELNDEYCFSHSISGIKPIDEEHLRSEDDFVKAIEKLQQEKVDYFQKTKITKLTFKEIQAKRKEIRDHEDLVQWAKQQYLECLKTEFIFKHIITPIEKDNLLRLDSRTNVQFLYLLSSRCFKNMSFVSMEAKEKDHEVVKALTETVAFLYEKVKQKFYMYDNYLLKIEEKISSVISDRWKSIFNSEEKEKKDKLMNGLEKYDYKKEEQIRFTYDHYVKQIITRIEPKNHSVVSFLEKYVQINMITRKDYKDKKFLKIIQELTNRQIQK